jgi:hypothetical protein
MNKTKTCKNNDGISCTFYVHFYLNKQVFNYFADPIRHQTYYVFYKIYNSLHKSKTFSVF